MTYEPILLETENNIAKIIFNNPEENNAIHLPMANEFSNIIDKIEEDDEIKLVIITGCKDTFCSGYDIKEIYNNIDSIPSYMKRINSYLHNVISCIAHMNKPVISVVNGLAAACGFSIAIACDIVISSDRASYVSNYTTSSATPDCALTYTLSRIVGIRKAIDIIYLNPKMKPQEALQYGLINYVFPHDELWDRTNELTDRLISIPPKVLGASKRLVMYGSTTSLETQLERETQSMTEMSRTPEFKNRIISRLTEKGII